MSVTLAGPDKTSDFRVPENATSAEAGRQLIQRLIRHAKSYQGADHKRSLQQFAISLAGYAFFSALVIATHHAGAILLSIALMVPAAGFLIRLFIVQHDCGHGSFFNRRAYNNAVGRFVSVFTFTPYDFWRRSHNLHHAHSGNIDRRGIGGVDTLTVAEYRALPAGKKVLYRLFRNPALLLLVLAPFNILLFQRVPPNRSVPWLHEYDSLPARETLPSIMGLNLALLAVYGALGFLIGWEALFLAFLPIVYLAGILGGWLFYIQHQFEHTFWQKGEAWSFHEAALYGSSHYVLPPLFRWFSGSIGLHHLHHFNAKIPNYRLQDCVNASPELQQMNRMTFRQSLACLRWALWDEEEQRLVGFSRLKTA